MTGKPRGLWKALLIRPVLYAIPFGVLFSFLQGEGLATLPLYYAVSVGFAIIISAFIEANRAWVAPRLVPPDRPPGPPSPLVIASFATAGMLGSVTSAALLHFTIAPQTFGSGRAIVVMLLFSAGFMALFLGWIYSTRMSRLYVQRVREEAERTAREEQEMKVAAAVQQALLPPRLRTGPGYAAAGASIPCRTIGGDFFEYFDLPGGRVGFALGDVAGKGPPAALLAARVQGVFMSNVGTKDDSSPAATMTRVNQALLSRPIEARFATMAYLILSPDGRLVSCSAGHNPVYVIGADGTERRLDRGGLMIGAFEGVSYEEEAIDLRSGDTVVLYSDGATDAENPEGEQFGDDRFRALLFDGNRPEEPPAMLDRVLCSVQAFAADRPLADDVTVLIVRYQAARSPNLRPEP